MERCLRGRAWVQFGTKKEFYLGRERGERSTSEGGVTTSQPAAAM